MWRGWYIDALVEMSAGLLAVEIADHDREGGKHAAVPIDRRRWLKESASSVVSKHLFQYLVFSGGLIEGKLC